MIHATASLYGFFTATHGGGLVIGNRLEKRFLVIFDCGKSDEGKLEKDYS